MTPTIDEISTALINGLPTLSADEQHLARVVYRLLATGRPATIDTIAAEAQWTVGDVEARLDSSPAVFRDDDGAVVGFLGLARSPGPRCD